MAPKGDRALLFILEEYAKGPSAINTNVDDQIYSFAWP